MRKYPRVRGAIGNRPPGGKKRSISISESDIHSTVKDPRIGNRVPRKCWMEHSSILHAIFSTFSERIVSDVWARGFPWFDFQHPFMGLFISKASSALGKHDLIIWACIGVSLSVDTRRWPEMYMRWVDGRKKCPYLLMDQWDLAPTLWYAAGGDLH